mgnify:CR=1 FL=1
MHSKEWPLIGFTLAAQFAVGMVVGLAVISDALADRVGAGPADDLGVAVLISALALLLSAGAVATFHLGNVRNVHLVLANWRSSWLSREVLMVGIFTAGVVVYTALFITDSAGSELRTVVGVATSVVGLTLVATIARLYMLRTVPVWNRSATPLAFFASTVLLGAIGLAVFVAFLDADRTGGIQAVLGALTLVALAVELVGFQLHRSRLPSEHGAAAVSGRVINETHANLVRARLAIVGTVVLILIATAIGWLPPRAGLTVAGLLVIASEMLGRYLFYVSYARSGL